MKVIPTSDWMRLSSTCISSRSFRSSAPSGSSSSSTLGRFTRARASATRWRWPPDSWVMRRDGEVLEAHHLEGGDRPGAALGPADALDLEPVLDVLPHAQVGEEGVVLEHGVDVPVVGRRADDVAALEQDLALGGLLEARDHPEAGRLARARGPEEREELAGTDRQIHVLDGRHGTESLRDIDQGDVIARRVGQHAPSHPSGSAPGKTTRGPGSGRETPRRRSSSGGSPPRRRRWR